MLGFRHIVVSNVLYCFLIVTSKKKFIEHGMARPQVADRGTASDKEGSCE